MEWFAFRNKQCKRIAWVKGRGVRLRGGVRAVLRGARLGRGVREDLIGGGAGADGDGGGEEDPKPSTPNPKPKTPNPIPRIGIASEGLRATLTAKDVTMVPPCLGLQI
jgi:hypothetical protein